MIQKIEIQNYQSHKKTELEFSPGVNLIVGQSDSGKTAIIRALRWLVWNRPLGDAFRSHWGGDTSVVLRTDNGIHVERFKGKEDHYLLTNPEADELEFKAFGTEPPEEITQALRLSELNLQSQHDNAFLISNNPGEVARHFNKVANIDKIDSSLKAVESWVRKLRQDVQATEEEIVRHQEQLKKFEYLDIMETDIEMLESLESEKEKMGSQIQRLSTLLSDIERVETDIQEASILLPAEEQVNDLLELYKELDKQHQEYQSLKTLCLEITECQTEIEDFQELINDEGQINLILDLYNKLKIQEDEYNSLDTLVLKIVNTQQELKNKQQEVDEYEIQWHENMPETCPLCGK